MQTYSDTTTASDEEETSLIELLRLLAGGAYDRSDAAAFRLWQEAA